MLLAQRETFKAAATVLLVAMQADCYGLRVRVRVTAALGVVEQEDHTEGCKGLLSTLSKLWGVVQQCLGVQL